MMTAKEAKERMDEENGVGPCVYRGRCNRAIRDASSHGQPYCSVSTYGISYDDIKLVHKELTESPYNYKIIIRSMSIEAIIRWAPQPRRKTE